MVHSASGRCLTTGVVPFCLVGVACSSVCVAIPAALAVGTAAQHTVINEQQGTTHVTVLFYFAFCAFLCALLWCRAGLGVQELGIVTHSTTMAVLRRLHAQAIGALTGVAVYLGVSAVVLMCISMAFELPEQVSNALRFACELA